MQMSKSLDRLTLLATFARIAERGSISAAARDIGLSQASASRHLAELEDRFGVQLIHRTTHSLSLTEDGKDVLAEARSLLEGWEALAERFAEDEQALRGKLKIVAPVALGQLYLARAALDFQRAHPAVSITWLLEDAPIRFAEIGCDLWIKIGQPRDETLIVREVGRVERLIVAAPALVAGTDIAEPQHLAALPCAALEPFEGASIPLTHESGAQRVASARTALLTNNIFAAREAARLGVGYAVMPRWFVEADLQSGALLDVLPRWRAPSRTITASYLPARRQTQRLQQFTAHIAQAIADTPGIDALP